MTSSRRGKGCVRWAEEGAGKVEGCWKGGVGVGLGGRGEGGKLMLLIVK